MAKKRVVKRKLRISRLLLLLFILLVIAFLAYLILNTKIKNIIITGNNYINDEDIIETAGLTNYPKFLFTTEFSIKNKLKQNKAIKNVKVKKTLHNTIIIEIKEYDIVLKKDNNYILDNGEMVEVNKNIGVPRLLNDVPSKQYKNLLESLKTVNKNVLAEVSELEYVPNTYDKDRFLLYMNDGNAVYLTLTKFEKINYYDRVLAQLEDKHGFLYLDSGNHFKIME